jgi:hypothetical protein
MAWEPSDMITIHDDDHNDSLCPSNRMQPMHHMLTKASISARMSCKGETAVIKAIL